MTVFHVNGEQDSVLVDDYGFVTHFAVDGACAQWQAFFFAHFGIAAFVDATAVRLLGEQFVNVFAVDFGAGGQDFHRVNVGVLVDDAAWNAVVLGVNQAEC